MQITPTNTPAQAFPIISQILSLLNPATIPAMMPEMSQSAPISAKLHFQSIGPTICKPMVASSIIIRSFWRPVIFSFCSAAISISAAEGLVKPVTLAEGSAFTFAAYRRTNQKVTTIITSHTATRKVIAE